MNMQWEHIEAVLRGQLPYWLSAMRAWSTQDYVLYGAFVVVAIRTLRSCK